MGEEPGSEGVIFPSVRAWVGRNPHLGANMLGGL